MAAYIIVIGPVFPSSIERVLRCTLVLGCVDDDCIVDVRCALSVLHGTYSSYKQYCSEGL